MIRDRRRFILANQKKDGGVDVNTLLLLRGDSSIDASIYQCPITELGGIPLTTSKGKFDKAFDWNGSKLFAFDVILPKILNGELTVEFWVYPEAFPNSTYYTICDFCNHSVLYIELLESSGKRPAYFIGNGSLWQNQNIQWGTIDVNVIIGNWYHVAFVGDGSVVRSYVNGILTNTSTSYPNFINNKLRIGNIVLAMNRYMRGRLSEFRVSDVARYSGDSFSPPTKPF